MDFPVPGGPWIFSTAHFNASIAARWDLLIGLRYFESLVTCSRNVAVESIAQKLIEFSDQMLVIGNPSRIGPTAANHLLSRKCSRHHLVAKASKIAAWMEAGELKIRRELLAKQATVLANGGCLDRRQTCFTRRRSSCSAPGWNSIWLRLRATGHQTSKRKKRLKLSFCTKHKLSLRSSRLRTPLLPVNMGATTVTSSRSTCRAANAPEPWGATTSLHAPAAKLTCQRLRKKTPPSF